MSSIYLITNHKGNFGNKYKSIPYHSGLNKDLLSKLFINKGIEPIFTTLSDFNFRDKDYKGKNILYTSTEDKGGYYKSYLEDVIYALDLNGANVIPSFTYLKAHHNKVFMEIIRDFTPNKSVQSLLSKRIGTDLEFENQKNNFTEDNYVIKKASGASSIGVFLAKNKAELEVKIKEALKVQSSLYDRFKEFVREIKHKGYNKITNYRSKIIVQEYIPFLQNDWKVLVYGDKYFIVERPVRKNDFRASGSGKDNYNFGKDATIPNGIFDFAEDIYKSFNVPFISLDIAFDGEKFYLFEFQFIAFGTSTVQLSKHFFIKENNEWIDKQIDFEYEELFVESIINFINKKV